MSQDTTLRVLMLGEGDLLQMVRAPEEGGRAKPSLAELVAARPGGWAASIEVRPIEKWSDASRSLRESGAPDAGVVLISVASAIEEACHVDDVETWFLETGSELVSACREQQAHLLVANGSTYDPDDRTHTYAGISDPPPLVVHRLNLALIQLSVLDGISIVDADRIIAELGGEQVVEHLCSYRPAAATSLCREIDRILEEYRFFDSGALVPQSGRRKD